MRGLNEIVKEAFFDDHLEDKDAPVKAAIEDWINKHSQEDASRIQINDDLTLSTRYACMYLDENEQIPEYIRFKQANSLAIYGEMTGDPIKLHKDLLPPTMKRFGVVAVGVEFDNGCKTNIDELTISNARSVILSKKMTVSGKLNLTNCRELEKLENIQGVKYINVPNDYAAKLFRKVYNYKGGLCMNGFGPY